MTESKAAGVAVVDKTCKAGGGEDGGAEGLLATAELSADGSIGSRVAAALTGSTGSL